MLQNLQQYLFNNLFKIIIITCIIVLLMLGYISLYIYRLWFKRYKNIKDLPKSFYAMVLYGVTARIYDGDTFLFMHTPKYRTYKKKRPTKLTIRLAGIDAPEVAKFDIPAQKFANESKNLLKSLIKDKKIKVKLLKEDIYGKILATVFVNEVNVCLEMVKKGMACVYFGINPEYDGYKKKFLKAEAKAKKERIGIWSDPNYISPMDYKKMIRQKKI